MKFVFAANTVCIHGKYSLYTWQIQSVYMANTICIRGKYTPCPMYTIKIAGIKFLPFSNL